jgi:hypothetical protein
MPDATLYVKHPTSGEMIPVKADIDGKLVISDADPFTVAQDTPEALKHVPHGYSAVGGVYLPFKVDEDGVLQISGGAAGSLDDLTDVTLVALVDGHFLSYSVGLGIWQNRLLAETDIPAEIARDAEVTDAIGDHAAIAAAHHTKTVDASELTAGALPTARLSTNIKTLTITFIIDGGGSAITTGEKGHLEIPFACTIQQVTTLADQSGSIVVDIWKDTYANFPPTNADTITSVTPPTITTATKSQDATLTNWITAVTAGDILAFNVDSCTTITRVTISLKVVKT